MSEIESLYDKIYNADCVLLAFGEEFRTSERDRSEVVKAYNSIAKSVHEKNYYVLNICDDDAIFESDFDSSRIAAPFKDSDEKNKNNKPGELFDRTKNPEWDKYMKWLSCTLNKKLVIVELGCLMGTMELVRWPFEKTVSLNMKSELVRINRNFPFVPAEISDRTLSIGCNSVDFLL